LIGSRAVAPEAQIQRHIFPHAHFLDISAIFSGHEIKIDFICDAQFFRVRAIVLFAWRVD
jgi:hypothetical protein